MSQSVKPTPRLSLGVRVVVSAVIAFHFLAVIGGVLIAPSGPWPMPNGGDMATPPHFAQLLMFGPDFIPDPAPGTVDLSLMGYLKVGKMTHNFHFISNRPPDFETRIEAKLRDANGEVMQVIHFPDQESNFIARHRQQLLAEGLSEDEPVEPLPGESIPAPNQEVRTVRIWEPGEGRTGEIRQVEEHLIPRDRPVFGPSDWSMVVARSFARHLCREHGAASVELIRHTKPLIPPDVVFLDPKPQAGTFDESIVSFGVFNAPAQQN